MSMHRWMIWGLFAACLAGSAPSGAEELEDAGLEAIVSRGPRTTVATDRSWLYNDPTVIAKPGSAIGVGRLSYSGGDSLTRPFASGVATAGAVLEIGGEVGLAPGISAMAIGAEGLDPSGSSRTGAVFGLRWSLLPESLRSTQLVLSGGLLRELQGHGGAWARAALGQSLGAARLAVSVHGERIFADGRDALDLMVTAGATYRISETLRAGLEYVGQDLEETFDDGAEGGPRQILGPVVAMAFLNQRLSLVGGPAVALGTGQGRLLGRLALSCQF